MAEKLRSVEKLMILDGLFYDVGETIIAVIPTWTV